METREQYVQWCKDRAMDCVRRGDLLDGVTSMMSDMDKRDDTKLKGILNALGVHAAMAATKGDKDAVERFILGFN